MSESPLVSIIVPVYQVEQYLQTCIESILKQTYDHWELILVDDGSPDRCGEICDEYAEIDRRIRVIHQKNSGVVDARNAGIKAATGKYLAFVDSDDYIDPRMYEELVSKAEIDRLQIVWCDWAEFKYTPSGAKETSTVSTGFEADADTALRNLLADKIKGFLWNKLIEKEYYDRCDIKTDAECTIMEDKYILVQLLCHHPRMGYVQKPLYNYLSRTDSATGAAHPTSPMVRGAANVLHIYEFLQERDLLSSYQQDFYSFAMKVKFAFANCGAYDKALKFIPTAHKSARNYPISGGGFVVGFYWLCFNSGKPGMLLWRLKHIL